MGVRLQVERLKRGMKQWGLTKAYLLITGISLLSAFLLTALTVCVCVNLREGIAPSGLAIVFDGDGVPTAAPSPSPAVEEQLAAAVIESAQYLLTVAYFTLAVAASGAVFYHGKLKHPIQTLQNAARRIMEQDLDFTIAPESADELGLLCAAFEKMRSQLQQNNRQLWRQAEERRRLNAAFAHDLRNPVTVLKGSIRVLEKGLEGGLLTREEALDSLGRLEQYTLRIEQYVEAMSGIQKLEDVLCRPQGTTLGRLAREFPAQARLLLPDAGVALTFGCQGERTAPLWLDADIFYTAAENLVANAGRYAASRVEVNLRLEGRTLLLTVQDDGPGYSGKILQRGMEPFLRDDRSDGQHLGMGLYSCRLLCEKHGGCLTLENTASGALACARFAVNAP